MYLSNIKLWSFRKFGSVEPFNLANPDLSIDFTEGLNVLIGENDSGKTAVIDAIKLVLKTHSFEWIKPTLDDFHEDSERFRIELRFENLSEEEAKNFTEWLGWKEIAVEGDEPNTFVPFLRLIYDVSRTGSRILPRDVAAGVDEEGYVLNAEAREYLKTTYLRPLRDAKAELIPRKNSRLSNIFQEHEAFKGREEDHHLIEIFRNFNKSVENYFEGKDADDNDLADDKKGKALKDEIDKYLKSFYDKSKSSYISTVDGKLKNILEKLELSVKDEINLGLGTLNRLFMASELVHLNKKDWTGVRLGLIEELEAHLHPQAQMQVVESLQNQKNVQLILSSHSPNLASKLKLENLIVFDNGGAYPMGKSYTKLDESDYKFLERFLDTTKANLFFANGVILVEGWSEEILLPAIVNKLKKQGVISKNLTEAGVSIVNVGNTALLRYSKVFLRRRVPNMCIPIAVITDSDIRTYQKIEALDEEGNTVKVEGKVVYNYNPLEANVVKQDSITKVNALQTQYESENVKAFITEDWTLEYALYKSNSLGEKFKEITLSIHDQMNGADFERELSKKLIIKTLHKTEIAYKLAHLLDEDSEKPFPEIELDENDQPIKNIIDAIKYTCGN